MFLKYFDNKEFDPKKMDLFYIYIPKYKIFEKQGFVIQPDYCLLEEEYSEGNLKLQVNKRKDFINLVTNVEDFIEKNNIIQNGSKKKNAENVFGLKIRVIVGKNGEGKTSLLNLLSCDRNPESLRQLLLLNSGLNIFDNSSEVECIYIFKDSEGHFAASAKCNIEVDGILYTVEIEDKEKSRNIGNIKNLCMNNHMEVPFEKGFLSSYLENKALYDGIMGSENLFTKFKIDYWDVESFERRINTNLPIKDSLSSISQSINILEYYFLVNLTNPSFNEILLNLTVDDENGEKIKSLFDDDIFYDEEQDNFFDTLLNENKDLSEFDEIQGKLKEYEKTLQERIKQIVKKNNLFDSLQNKEIIFETKLDDLLYFKCFDDRNYRFLEDFSDGEQNQLRYRYELNEYLKQDNPVWWYIDEPERSLHPEWARRFIDDYINAYNSVIKYLYKKGNKRVLQRNHTVLFTTHSPFILTDLTNDYIIFLSKEKRIHESAFLGNIGQLLVNNMFLSNTMGEHAKQIINQLIQTLNDSKKNAYIDKTKVKLIFNEIGDEVLKNILLEQLEGYEWKK